MYATGAILVLLSILVLVIASLWAIWAWSFVALQIGATAFVVYTVGALIMCCES